MSDNDRIFTIGVTRVWGTERWFVECDGAFHSGFFTDPAQAQRCADELEAIRARENA